MKRYEELFDNVNGGDCVDSAELLQELIDELLDVCKKAQKSINDQISGNAPSRTQWKERHLELNEIIKKAEGGQ